MTDARREDRADPWRAQLDALGGFIRAQRQLAALSLREMSSLTKVSNAYLSQVERGLHQPSLTVLRSIAEALGLSTEQLLAQEQFTDVARRGQEAVVVAMQAWAENMQKLVGTLSTGDATVAPNAEAVVDDVFNFAERMLHNQREFTKSLLAAATPSVPTARANGSKKS
ncbi:MAG: helix-turn-helix transcriptional regulator [Actinomycetota bacterium]|nr:helix-turn-helix transcriptional regulator [Actinomycetota bacterium]